MTKCTCISTLLSVDENIIPWHSTVPYKFNNTL